jgi:hypothetical protein
MRSGRSISRIAPKHQQNRPVVPFIFLTAGVFQPTHQERKQSGPATSVRVGR